MSSVVVGPPGDRLAVELRTLPIQLEADERGLLSHLKLGEREFPSTEALKVEIAEILVDPDLRFDRALLKVDERLQYAELIRVYKLLLDMKLDKIDLSLFPPGEFSLKCRPSKISSNQIAILPRSSVIP